MDKNHKLISELKKSNQFIYRNVEEITSFEQTLNRVSNEISSSIGFDLLEKVYQELIYEELKQIYEGIYIIRMEESIQIMYKNKCVGSKRLDIVVYKNDKVFIVIEVKNSTTDKGISQLDNYLKLTKCPLGYIVNFSSVSMSNQIEYQPLTDDVCIDFTFKTYTYSIYKLNKMSKQNETNIVEGFKKTRWSNEEEAILRQMKLDGSSVSDMSSVLNRSYDSIQNKIKKLIG